jgi:hypothetical protein
MKSFLKIVVLGLLFLCGEASADYVKKPMVYGGGENQGSWGTPDNNSQQQQFVSTSRTFTRFTAVEGEYFPDPSMSYGTRWQNRSCTQEEANHRSAGNLLTGAVLGGVAGVLATDNRRGTAIGAGIGILLSSFYNASTQCVVRQRVLVGERMSRNTIEVPSTCKINKSTWRGLSEEECAELAQVLAVKGTVKGTVSSAETGKVTKEAWLARSEKEPIKVNGKTCAITYGRYTVYDFLSEDLKLNPRKGAQPVSTGSECSEAKEYYKEEIKKMLAAS